jgi:3-phenylpropionate/trans-cinnamate dioxygenase ferredoxin reductase component
MNIASSILVVGAGAAGAQALLALRRLGYDGSIDLVGAEEHAPYERPPLSKDVLVSHFEPTPTSLVDLPMLADLDVRATLGHAVGSIDLTRRSAWLANGERLLFDRLLIATGASPRALSIPGAHLAGVYYLRTFTDASHIRDAFMQQGGPVVVIGGGFIGLEVAAAARLLNCPVTIIETGTQLMGRAVPAAIADIMAAEHRRRGVSVELGCRPTRLLGNPKVEAVQLEDGRVLPASVVVIGIGVAPQVSLGTQIGVATDDGIVVDIDCRTSVAGVFAAGDCCRVRSSEARGVRLEAWQSALDQGERAAHAMLGVKQPAPACAWMWSNQYDYQLQAAGAPTQVDQLVARGDPKRGELICFQLHKGHLVGAVSVNCNRDLAIVRRVLPAAPAVSHENLADEHWPLRRLLSDRSIASAI